MELDYENAVEYIAEIYSKTDKPAMKNFIEQTNLESFGPTIEDDIARLFKVLLKLIRPRRVIEIGMSIGFSTTSLALAVKDYDGLVTAIENDPDVVEYARKNFEREGVSNNIEIILGDATKILPEIKSESYDVVFQDSSKRLYPVMMKDCFRILRKGGLFLADDTLMPTMKPKDEWNVSLSALDDFNRTLTELNIESTILPIGEGCTVAVKL
ncbi:MAG: O-methyltransferase [Candidatus Thorarchaeota archaeon]|jgi:predicted O-methyltransferase YrrM